MTILAEKLCAAPNGRSPGPKTVEHLNVPPASLLPPSPDLRDRTTPDYIAWLHDLADNIKQHGILNPVHTFLSPEGERVLHGETRRQGALLAGLPTVPAIRHLEPMTEEEIELEKALENEMRQNLSDGERAEMYHDWRERFGWSQEKIARKSGKSQGYISKLLAFRDAFPEDCRAKIGRGPGKIRVTTASIIAQLGSHEAIRAMVEYALAEDLTRYAVGREVARRLGNRQKRKGPLAFAHGGIKGTIGGDIIAELRALRDSLIDRFKKIDKGELATEDLLKSLKK